MKVKDSLIIANVFGKKGGVSSVNGKTGEVTLAPSDLGIGAVFNLKGSTATTTELPASGNEIGDVWYVVAESVGYIWLNDGLSDRWEQLGLPIDLSSYAERTWVTSQITAQPSQQLVFTLEDNTTVTLDVVTKQVSGT